MAVAAVPSATKGATTPAPTARAARPGTTAINVNGMARRMMASARPRTA